MLTGHEQYYWERAGYFIRRRLLDKNGAQAWKGFVSEIRENNGGRVEEPESIAVVRELVQELLGPELLTETKLPVPLGTEWKRGNVLGTQLLLNATRGELAKSHRCASVCIATETDESLRVIPGSHTDPLSFGQLTALVHETAVDTTGVITLRLSEGDAVFLSPALLRKLEKGDKLRTALELLDFYV